MPKQNKADTSSVRALITSVTALATHLDLTPNAIYRWIKVNRIPGKYLLRVAAFYDIDVPLHLATSDVKNEGKPNYKPRETLPLCLEVQNGNLDLYEAAERLNIHPRAIQLILTNWGDQLQLLYDVLKQLDAKEMSLDQAAAALNVTKFNVHALRKKYGFRPEPRPKAPPRGIIGRRQTSRQIALACIAGKLNLNEVEKECELSWRTIHRAIAKLSPEATLIELTHWPKTFREAYSLEIAENLPQISKKLYKFAEISRISMKKLPKYPSPPANWRAAGVKKMMMHVLLGDETIESLAAKRGADPHILESLFTSDLRVVGLTWPEVAGARMQTQVALAELLLALEDANKTPRLKMIERLAEDKNDQ